MQSRIAHTTPVMNNSQIAHLWANQSRPRGTGSNFFFEGPELYSYGKHFMVGRILPSGVAVLATRGYSPTTQRHQSYARSAVRHLTRVYCNDPADSAATNARVARDAIVAELAAMQKPRIRQATKDKHAAEALHLAEQFNAYLAALGAEGVGTEPVDVTALGDLAAAAARAEEAQRAMEAERRKARAAALADTLAKWRTGEVLQASSLWGLPPALRLRAIPLTRDSAPWAVPSTIVETSHGASIPVADALKLWPIILRVKGGSKDYTPGEPLGDYRLTQIRTDGSIRVGCHDIAFSELQAIALQLGV